MAENLSAAPRARIPQKAVFPFFSSSPCLWFSWPDGQHSDSLPHVTCLRVCLALSSGQQLSMTFLRCSDHVKFPSTLWLPFPPQLLGQPRLHKHQQGFVSLPLGPGQQLVVSLVCSLCCDQNAVRPLATPPGKLLENQEEAFHFLLPTGGRGGE